VKKPMSVKCKMLVWNVWSIAKEEKLGNFLQILEDRNISIACITETWFDRKNGTFSKTIKDAGFKLNHDFRTDKRGGGCAIIYKRNLLVKNGKASSSEFTSFEYSSIILTLKSRRKLLIVCVYRKQEIQFTVFHNEFTSYMDQVMKAGNMLCVVGDFNVWVDVDGDKEAETMLELMSTYGLEQNVNGPTHREGHTLDQIYINPYQLDSHHSVI
jgi:exonuclease III